MANVTSLAQVQKHRTAIFLALTAGILLSTLPVRNERALFTPLGVIEGSDLPVAYAVHMRMTPVVNGGGGPIGGRNRSGSPAPSGGGSVGETPPTAFAARIPPQPLGTQPGSPAPFTTNAGGGGSNPSGPDFDLPQPGFTPATLTPPNPTSPVPEPATWTMMIMGFGFVGGMMRLARRRSRSAHPAFS